MSREEQMNKLFGRLKEHDEQFTFDEADWERLEKRLDEDEKKRYVFWWLPRAAAIAVLLVGCFVTFNAIKNSSGNELVDKIENKAPNSSDVAAEKVEQIDDIANSAENNVATESDEQKNTNEKALTIPFNNNYNNLLVQNDQMRSQPFTGEPLDWQESIKTNKQNTIETPINPLTENDELSTPESRPLLNKSNSDNPLFAENEEQDKIAEKTPTGSIKKENNVEELDTDKTLALKRFSLSVGFKPVSSGETLGNIDRIGTAVGLSANYDIGKTTTVSLGANYFSQKHRTPGDSYSNINGYWATYTNGQVPNQVNAQHKVVEVPIQLLQEIINKEQRNIYLAAGAVNTITFHEKHNFEFDNTYYSYQEFWTVEQNNLSLFNSAKVMLGMEQTLGSKLVIQVEPFVEIPLKKSAWGDLELVNKGVSINLKLK